jgi:hypothetical protein
VLARVVCIPQLPREVTSDASQQLAGARYLGGDEQLLAGAYAFFQCTFDAASYFLQLEISKFTLCCSHTAK